MFITFEGIDCSGKSTQIRLLVERLQREGKSVVPLREPGGTPLSEKVRTILLDHMNLDIQPLAEILLFSAARTQLVHQVICPALRDGKIVVCDRFYDSTTAYQSYGRGIPLKDVQTINRIATDGTTPDLTLLVDIEVEEINRRRHNAGFTADRMELAGTQFFERVREGYLKLAAEEPERIVLINGKQPVDAIHQEIWSIVHQRLSRTRA